MTLEAAVVSLSEALPALTELIRRQSIGRGQIVADQIRAAIRGDGEAGGMGGPLLVTIAARTGAADGGELVGLVVAAVQSTSSTATILIAGPTDAIRHVDLDVDGRESGGRGSWHPVAGAIQATLDRVLGRYGVTFVQWATDPIAGDLESVGGTDPGLVGGTDPGVTTKWAEGLGLRWMGNLGYWSADLGLGSSGELRSVGGSGEPERNDEATRLRLVPVDWSAGDPLGRLIAVVERTYEGTLDCPGLSRFRTPREIVHSYCDAPAFDPEAWYLAVESTEGPDAAWKSSRGSSSRGSAERRRATGECVGVVIGARHAGSSGGGGSRFVAELVYMGVVPEARGRGIGGQLLDGALRGYVAAGADRVILAVDEANGPAQKLYRAAGFRPMFRESVFAKGLSPPKE